MPSLEVPSANSATASPSRRPAIPRGGAGLLPSLPVDEDGPLQSREPANTSHPATSL
jgi:hypothetical protein